VGVSRNRWPVFIVIVLLGCLLAALCLTCVAAGWFLLRSGTVTPVSGGVSSADDGVLRLFGGEPRTLDPALVEDSVSAEYVVEIFSGLVSLDSRLQVVPDLAERWDVSPDGKTYTFYLRSGTRFHDGRAVTAADVKYSLERACSPSTGSGVAAVYLGDIVGAKEMLAGQAADISGIQTEGDNVVRIQIDAPKAYFLAKLTYSTAFVVDRNNLQSPDWLTQPNGTGPFKLREHTEQQIVLERNERYYRDPPALQQVIFYLSGGSPMSMYENGELDIVGVGTADVERVSDPDNPLHSELTIVPQLDVQYLGFDVTRSPFDDVHVRQAFNLAIDRQKVTEVVWKDMALPAEGILPPGMPGYTRDKSLLDFDPARAQRLLAESRYVEADRLPPITLTTGGQSGQASPTIEAIVAMLRENLGVAVSVEQTEDVFPPTVPLSFAARARPQFFSMGWIADYPDPEDFLDLLFYSKSGLNQTGYANSRVDELLEEARIETDDQRRIGLYKQAEELIVADAPWLPLWHSVDYMLTKPYVQGAVYAAAIYPWLGAVHVDR